tara:strand:+ start:216 stop:875 length:660 start_codon:yes stop_codon:yes gene_type:complete
MGSANQSVTPGRTTLLEAVNICLQNIGEQPVNSLENEQIAEAAMAERTILEFFKEGQTRGWSWNTEYEYEFTKNTDDQFVVPSNLVSFSPDQYDWNGRFILRGQKVYDKEERTYTIPDTVTEKLKADVIWFLPWNECPEAYNRWTTIRSARVFSDRVLADDSIFKYTAVDEQAALVELQRVELDQAQANSLTGGQNINPFPTFSPAFGLLGRNRSYLRG